MNTILKRSTSKKAQVSITSAQKNIILKNLSFQPEKLLSPGRSNLKKISIAENWFL